MRDFCLASCVDDSTDSICWYANSRGHRFRSINNYGTPCCAKWVLRNVSLGIGSNIDSDNGCFAD